MSRRVITATVAGDRGVFMISVAAELADMHPQTLRMYEQRGLITPQRSPKGTRLYSWDDVQRLRKIQQMTAELGMNLAGVEKVLELEEQLEALQVRNARIADWSWQEIADELGVSRQAVHKKHARGRLLSRRR